MEIERVGNYTKSFIPACNVCYYFFNKSKSFVLRWG